MMTEKVESDHGIRQIAIAGLGFLFGMAVCCAFYENIRNDRVPNKIEIKSKGGKVVGYADTSPRNMRTADFEDGAYLCFAVFKNSEDY